MLKKNIFIQYEGGFGHTITAPQILRAKFKDDWYLIFFYSNKRHNIFVKSLFDENFFFLKTFENFYFRKYLAKFIVFFFKILKIKCNILDYDKIFPDLLSSVKDKKTDKFIYEKKIWQILLKNKNKLDYSKIRKKKFSFKKLKCSFSYREGRIIGYDYNSQQRSFDSQFEWEKVFNSILKLGFKLFIINDKNDFKFRLDLIDMKLRKNFHYYSKYKKYLSKDEYNFLVGIHSDCYINQFSGSTVWKYIFLNRPQLILNGYPLNWASIKSVIGYKILNKKLNFKDMQELLNNDELYFNKKTPINVNLRDLNISETKKIIRDFLLNLDNQKSIAYTANDIKLNKNHPIRWSKSLISKSWYEFQKKELFLK